MLRVKTGNLTKSNLFEKGLSTIFIEYQFINAIKKYLSDIRFDLVVYSTPPITLEGPIRFVKNRDRCLTYLLLKDIFPQNAVDLGYLSSSGLVYRYFKNKERNLYRLSDKIGCMSSANVRYLLSHNAEMGPEQVEVCPNSIKPRLLPFSAEERKKLFDGLGIPNEAIVFLYGGNLGKPQGLGFFIDSLECFRSREDLFFLIIGSGTEYDRIADALAAKKYDNVKLYSSLPKSEYDKVVVHANVGLIFLDHRFTIPNFPSRLTAYLEAGLPVLAATDTVSDIKECLADAGCGLWVESGDQAAFFAAVNQLAESAEYRKALGKSGRQFLEANFDVKQSVQKITQHLIANE